MTTVYVVSRIWYEPWEKPKSEPSERVVAIYSSETSARTHVASACRKVGRGFRVSVFEVDAPCVPEPGA